MVVGRGGSQTFTITPNAGYGRATVLVDGVNNTAAVTSGTYTFTNVQAPHTISATFTQGTTTITASVVGGGGSVTPAGVTTVAIGSSPVYTITPNNGYTRATVTVDGVPNATAVTSGTYTFTGVTGVPHTISATFTANTPTTITVPSITGTYTAPNASLPVSWTTSAAVPVGAEFAVWADSGTGWYIGKLVAANGTSSYATSVTLNVPPGTTYSIRVGYRATAGSGAWSPVGQSSGNFTVTAGLVITVPSITGTYTAPNASLPVSWTTSAAVPVGAEFAVWADSGTGWYIGKLVAADGTASYNTSVTLNVPPGTTYSIRVGYRATAGSGAWSPVGQSSGNFTVTAGLVITVPSITGTYTAPNASLPVSWTTSAAVPVGAEFAVWADSGTGWYIGKLVAADGTASYNTSVTLNVPPGTTYSIRVGYRATAGSGAWSPVGQSSGTFTVN